MFRIRPIFDDTNEFDRIQIQKVIGILKEQFPRISEKEIRQIGESLSDPVRYRFRTVLYVAEKSKSEVIACAVLMHFRDLNFTFLDYISVPPGKISRGNGGILYERIREEAKFMNMKGIFFECLPDDPALCPDPLLLKQNQARLKFYERYEAFPVVGTRYESPLYPGDVSPPYLMFDDLNTGQLPGREEAKKMVRAILERKYSEVCTPEYIDMVVQSFTDDPIRLRAHRYIHRPASRIGIPGIPASRKISLIVNQNHQVHHIRERGYVESPVRIKSILKQIEPTGLFTHVREKNFPEKILTEVHDREYVNYFRKVCENLTSATPLYPYVFPIRNKARPPRVLSVRAGYYCIDTFTPITAEAFSAAKSAVNAALTGAELLLQGEKLAYALVRPPGHHAEKAAFGGFCYFNSGAIAAHLLSKQEKVCILDLDYHHGNGQQDIFYNRRDVLTISIHGHPNFAYPYFSGFPEETGEGPGLDFNINFPMAQGMDGGRYRATLKRALRSVRQFRPAYLVIAFGVDTAKNDPTGSWSLTPEDFYLNGHMIGELKLQTLVVQEGGYDNRVIGTNVKRFFTGLWEEMYRTRE